tara:strand:+ start:6749 stop:6973 length:225 start_codon:yes stop_codon:yes gene_type:complete
MLSKQRKTNSKHKNLVRFDRCRVCGNMIDNKNGSYVITASNIFICCSCYDNNEWNGKVSFDEFYEFKDLSRKMK